jgi:hypothetical protein
MILLTDHTGILILIPSGHRIAKALQGGEGVLSRHDADDDRQADDERWISIADELLEALALPSAFDPSNFPLLMSRLSLIHRQTMATNRATFEGDNV